MARIIFPEDFLNQLLLFKNVKEKNDSLTPPTNPLTAFLVQKSISFAIDDVARVAAKGFEKERADKSQQAENRTQKRDLQFDPVFSNMRNYYQFLKKFYSPNFMEIGEWGAPITTTGRLAYPSEFTERVAIFRLLKDKYDTFVPPAISPLDAYLNQHGLSIAANTTAVDVAEDMHNKAKQLAQEAEDATQDRNNTWNPVMENLRAIGGFLISLYTNNPKELGDWGFIVDESPRAPKQVVSKVKLGSQITISNLAIGGTFKNLGTVALIVYKGKTATGPSVSVSPGDMYGITKGFSTITVVNPSTTTTAVLSTLRHR